MKGEKWKDVPGYEGLYMVSDLGRVKSLKRKTTPGKILKSGKDGGGYYYVNLCNIKAKSHHIHKLVAAAFLGHIPNGITMVVDHINFDRTDNRLINLQVITSRENGNQKHIKSSSKFTGVCWCSTREKWNAAISINGKKKNLGRFNNEHDAHLAYQKALKKLENATT